MGLLDFIFRKNNQNVEQFLKNSAVIIDVRSQDEWNAGHIENAMHIPLDQLQDNVVNIKNLKKPVITCCASGVRSAKAARFLNYHNIEATNGGGWASLNKKL